MSKVSNPPIRCRYCAVEIVSHHYLNHLYVKHKEQFIEANLSNFHSDSYDSKPIPLDINPSGSLYYYGCLGCMTAVKAEGFAKKHFDKPECKRKHLEFLLDVRHRYPKTGPKPSALALNPTVVRNVQKLVWELLEEIKENDKAYKYDWYSKAFRKNIPIALDEATLTKLFKEEEEEKEEEKEEDTSFLIVSKNHKSKREAFDELDSEIQEQMLSGGYDPDQN